MIGQKEILTFVVSPGNLYYKIGGAKLAPPIIQLSLS